MGGDGGVIANKRKFLGLDNKTSDPTKQLLKSENKAKAYNCALTCKVSQFLLIIFLYFSNLILFFFFLASRRTNSLL